MTVEDLIAELEQYPAEAEVRIAYQPSYPLYTTIGDVTDTKEGEVAIDLDDWTHMDAGEIQTILDENEIDDRPLTFAERDGLSKAIEDAKTVVYIGEGGGDNGYLPAGASSRLGWR